MQAAATLKDDLDPLVSPLRDNEFLIDLIADISGSTVSDVTRRFVREHRDLGSNVREAMTARGLKPYVWSERLDKFYAETDAFLYESLVWNRTAAKNDMRRWIGKHLGAFSASPLRVLTFGDGLGLDAYYLAESGHDVTYFDVSQQCARFARRIFERGSVDVAMLSDATQVQDGSFDVVVCLDVLEHVPDPISLVGWLSGRLRRGGRLLVHAPFFFLHSCVGTHLRSNRKYSGDLRRLYRPFGLRPVDGRLFWTPVVLELSEGQGRDARRRAPWQVTISGLLLAVARFWSLPHVMASRMMMRPKRLVGMLGDLATAEA